MENHLNSVDLSPQKIKEEHKLEKRRRHHHKQADIKPEVAPTTPRRHREGLLSLPVQRKQVNVTPMNELQSNYIDFIEEQKMKLKSINQSIQSSRQLRAMRESNLTKIQYTKSSDPFGYRL